MKLTFTPIARRDLKFESSNQSMDVVIALSAPYRPPKTPMASDWVAACMIQNCDDPTLALEIGGDDEFQALEMALICLEKFMKALAADKTGKLVNQDGTPFEANNASLLAYLLGRSN